MLVRGQGGWELTANICFAGVKQSNTSRKELIANATVLILRWRKGTRRDGVGNTTVTNKANQCRIAAGAIETFKLTHLGAGLDKN